MAAFESEGNSQKGIALAEQVRDAGIRLGDRNLEALGLQDKGRFLVAMGHIEKGLCLVDEAMIAAVAGELDPQTTGRSYCNMLAVCVDVADYERAAEWSDAARSWCDDQPDAAYPGICRMFRAELTWLSGSWDDAAEECRRAISELAGFTPIIGATLHQAGEIELRAGRLEEAAVKFREANEHGFTPLPGLAKLRLREGRPADARDLMSDAFKPDALGLLDRARLLPTWIDIHMALEAREETETALEELESAGEMCGSVAMQSAACLRRGRMALDARDADRAVSIFESAIKGWTELKMPYEAAEAHLLLAEARHASGNNAAAELELDSARSIFERLGAEGNVERVETILAG